MENPTTVKNDEEPSSIPNSNNEISTVSQNKTTRYWQESYQLLSLFPSVVWDHICSFLDSQDFLNLNNSSPFLQDLFIQKRVLFLYKPVLELLLPRFKKESDSLNTLRREDRTVDSLLLNSRLVCKSWKWTVDKLASTWIPDDKSGENNYAHHVLSENYKSIEIEKFLQNFLKTHSSSVNPFIGRYISLLLHLERPDFPKISNLITTLLDKYGHHLVTCEIRLLCGFLNPPDLQIKLLEWLSLMPNLENLRIYCRFQMRPTNMHPDCDELVPAKLNHLKKLIIKTYCPSVSYEHLPHWSWMERYSLSKLICMHKNLDFLHVTIYNKSDIEMMERFNSPLKALVATYHCKEDDVSMYQVFEMFSEKFGNTLEKLNITFRVTNRSSGHIQIIRDSFNGRLNLPKVRKFEINVMGMFSLDFLLGMKESLEELVIYCVGTGSFGNTNFSEIEKEEIEEMESKQIVKFLGYQNRLMESNIWSLFPKLQKVLLKPFGMNLEYTRGSFMKVLYQVD